MEKIAIIGAGLIGRAWAMVFARAGHPVKLWDNDAGRRAQGAAADRGRCCASCSSFGLVTEDPRSREHARNGCRHAGRSRARTPTTCRRTRPSGVDVKQQVYAQMDAAAPPDCILASSTSTIPTSVFSEGLKGKQRCIVAHPVNPPHVVPVVELSPAPWTSPEVVERSSALHEKVGQVPIIVKREVAGLHPESPAGRAAERSLAAGEGGLRHRRRPGQVPQGRPGAALVLHGPVRDHRSQRARRRARLCPALRPGAVRDDEGRAAASRGTRP